MLCAPDREFPSLDESIFKHHSAPVYSKKSKLHLVRSDFSEPRGLERGGLYEVSPASASTTCWVLPHLFEIRDNLGHWRHMDFRQLTFITSKGRVLFSQVEA